MDDKKNFKVVRLFQRSGRKFTVMWGVTESVARLHCKSKETSFRTCTTQEGKTRTRRSGPWFDAYEEM